MGDWFRNTRWDDEIAATFEARLSRARQKAGYLTIQGYTLLAHAPFVAAGLLRRAIALDEAAETARAGLYLGTALAIAGDLNGAIAALEDAIDAEKRHPMFRTAAYLDQALLIALAQRSDLYDVALSRLEGEQALPFADQQLSARISQALIGNERGGDVAAMAAAALEDLERAGEGSPEVPTYLSADLLKRRLEAIAFP